MRTAKSRLATNRDAPPGRRSHGAAHLTPLAVGFVVLGLSLANGGYGLELQAACALIVWWSVLAGLLFGVLPSTPTPGAALIAGGALVGIALLSGISALWAGDAGLAVNQAPRAALYAGAFALVVLAAGPGSARRWLGGLATGLTAVALVALASRLLPNLFPAPEIPSFLPAARARLSYPINYWNGLGAGLALASVLLGWLAGDGRGRALRTAATAALPAVGLALYLTSSRGGVAAMGVGLLVLIALAQVRAPLLLSLVLGGAGAAVLVLAAEARPAFVDGRTGAAATEQGTEMLLIVLGVSAGVALGRLALDRAGARLDESVAVQRTVLIGLLIAVAAGVALADPSTRIDRFTAPPAFSSQQRGIVANHLLSDAGNGRWQFWRAATEAFEAHPLAGVGAGGFEAWWTRHGSFAYHVRDAHSLLFELLAELGLLGLALAAVFLVTSVLSGLRRADVGAARAAGLAVIVCGGVSAAVDWTWELPAVFLPVVVAAATLTGPALPGWRRTIERPAWGLAVAGVSWLAIVVCALILVGQLELGTSRESARQSDLPAAAGAAREAAAVLPWDEEPRLQLALVRERGGDLKGAAEAIDEALARAPDSWRTLLIAARIRAQLGDVRGATRAARRARELNPRSPLFARSP